MAKAPKKRPAKNRVTTPKALPPPADPLTENERAFVLLYEAHGRNATEAYLALHPGVKRTTAAVEGCKILRNPKVRAELEAESKERFARLEMKADEALFRISETARIDPTDAYDEDGKLLPFRAWPEALRRAVKAIRADGSFTLHDSMRAQELMAQAGGKLKAGSLVLTFDHAKYLGAAPPEE